MMANLTVWFSGLVLFTSPASEKPKYSSAVMVTGDNQSMEVHLPVLEIERAFVESVTGDGGGKGSLIRIPLSNHTTVTVSDGSAAAPTTDDSFAKYVPSVSDALKKADVTRYRLADCAVKGEAPCDKQAGFVRMVGGGLSAMPAEKEDYYLFRLENGKGTYESPMTHQVSWNGTAAAITITKSGSPTTIKLKNGDVEATIRNEPPQQGVSRHFGVFRLLWGMGNNGSQDGFPLPYPLSLVSDFRTAVGPLPQDDPEKKEAFERLIVLLMTPNRPIFCPPARQ